MAHFYHYLTFCKQTGFSHSKHFTQLGLTINDRTNASLFPVIWGIEPLILLTNRPNRKAERLVQLSQELPHLHYFKLYHALSSETLRSSLINIRNLIHHIETGYRKNTFTRAHWHLAGRLFHLKCKVLSPPSETVRELTVEILITMPL